MKGAGEDEIFLDFAQVGVDSRWPASPFSPRGEAEIGGEEQGVGQEGGDVIGGSGGSAAGPPGACA